MHTYRRLLTAACSLLIVSLAAPEARAEWNPTPIAVPLIGTSGPASPYPSTIVMNPPGGALTLGSPLVKLHAVTHPCPKDLAVLVVHNFYERYLLLRLKIERLKRRSAATRNLASSRGSRICFGEERRSGRGLGRALRIETCL